MSQENFQIIKEVKNIRIPRISFVMAKEKILGKRYELSVSCVSARTSAKLNKEFRNKNYPTTILSFPLSKSSGEIILEPKTIRAQAKEFAMQESKFLLFLFIHGLLHLAEYEHGSTMKQAERKWCAYFNIAYPDHE